MRGPSRARGRRHHERGVLLPGVRRRTVARCVVRRRNRRHGKFGCGDVLRIGMLTLRIAAAVLVLVVSANGLADASVASSSEGEALGRPEAKMLYLRLSSPGGQHRDLF